VELQGARLNACVNLIKAIGCGWTTAPQPPSQTSAIANPRQKL